MEFLFRGFYWCEMTTLIATDTSQLAPSRRFQLLKKISLQTYFFHHLEFILSFMSKNKIFQCSLPKFIIHKHLINVRIQIMLS